MIINNQSTKDQILQQVNLIISKLNIVVNQYQPEVPILREILKGNIVLQNPMETETEKYKDGYEFINSWTTYIEYKE